MENSHLGRGQVMTWGCDHISHEEINSGLSKNGPHMCMYLMLSHQEVEF